MTLTDWLCAWAGASTLLGLTAGTWIDRLHRRSPTMADQHSKDDETPGYVSGEQAAAATGEHAHKLLAALVHRVAPGGEVVLSVGDLAAVDGLALVTQFAARGVVLRVMRESEAVRLAKAHAARHGGRE